MNDVIHAHEPGTLFTYCGKIAARVDLAKPGDWPAVTCAECKRRGDDR